MHTDEEITLRPIRDFAALACASAVPGSPLRALQAMPLYQSPPDDTCFSPNLMDEAITLLFAGQDTSAATLSWTLHLLSLSPDIQDKLAKQVRTVYRSGSLVDGQWNKRALSQIPFLDAVIKESMRLYPVAPFVVRRLPESLSMGGNVELPAETVACIWIYSLHRHPDYWSRPHDFSPERWLSSPPLPNEKGNRVDPGRTNGAYMPFAAGPRNCVGQPLAQAVLRTLLASLLVHYEFRHPALVADPQRDPVSLRKDMQAGFTVLPQDGVQVLVRARTTPNDDDDDDG
jgi:cytochrome P450